MSETKSLIGKRLIVTGNTTARHVDIGLSPNVPYHFLPIGEHVTVYGEDWIDIGILDVVTKDGLHQAVYVCDLKEEENSSQDEGA